LSLCNDERGLVSTLVLVLLASLTLLGGAVSCGAKERIAVQETETAKVGLATQEKKTEQSYYDFKTAEENRLGTEKEVELEQVKGDNILKDAAAKTIEWQTVGHIILQIVWVLIAGILLFGLGLLIAWVLESPNGPLRRKQ